MFEVSIENETTKLVVHLRVVYGMSAGPLFRQLGHHLSNVNLPIPLVPSISSLPLGEMIQHNCIGEMSVIPTAAPSAGDTRLVVPGISPGTPAAQGLEP